MANKKPAITRLKSSQARENFSQTLGRVFRREARVVIEKSGIPVAALISAEDLERFLAWEAERERRFGILDEIGKAFEDVPPEEIEREVSRAIAQVREEQRRKDRRSA